MIGKYEKRLFENGEKVWVGRYRNLSNLPHWHFECELIYIVRGRAEIQIGEDVFRAQADDCFLCHGEVSHRIESDEDTDIDILYFHKEIAKTLVDRHILVSPRINQGKYVKKSIKDIRSILMQKAPFYKMALETRAQGILVDIYDTQESILFEKRDVLSQKIVDKINNQFAHITFEESAHFAGYSPGHFSKIFKRDIGMSFTDYLNHVKIENAVALMRRNPGLSSTELCALCGFSSMRNFNRVFKLVTGYSPKTLPDDFIVSSSTNIAQLNDFDPTDSKAILLNYHLTSDDTQDNTLPLTPLNSDNLLQADPHPVEKRSYRMYKVFDITDYGAVDDGTTDCTHAIQQALDDAAKVEGTVIVPPGKYLTGQLRMGARTRLEGYSGWSQRADGLSTLVLNDPDSTCLLNITGAFGCSVSGICLNGQNLGEQIHGVYLNWAWYNGGAEEDTPTFEGCRIGHFTGDGMHLEHVWLFTLHRSMLHNNRGSGLYIDGWDAIITDNLFSHNRYVGVRGGSLIESITTAGNRVTWNWVSGFWFQNGRSISITNNFFDRSFGPAIKLGDGGHFHDCTITGNIFRRSGCDDHQPFKNEYESSHVYFDDVQNVTLTGNTFEWGVDDTGYGTKSPDYNVYMANCSHTIIQSNTMYNGAIKGNIIYDKKGENIIKDNLPNYEP